MNFFKYFPILLLLCNSILFSSVDFTKDEKIWIKENPIVKLGADYKWPPFDFADNNGNHTGLSAEYIKLISQKSGLKFDVTTGVWSDILEGMKKKKYDGLTCAVKTDERRKYLNFTTPYLLVPMVIITTTDNKTIKTIDSLFKKVVSINRGSYIHEWLKIKYPQIKLHLTTSNKESLEAVSLGKADAYVGNQAVATFIMNKYLLSNLNIVSKLKGFETAISIAIDKDNKILFNIIQKTLNSITSQEHQEIKQKWKENLLPKSKLLKFTKKQQKWIDKHKIIRYVIDNHWMPIEGLSKHTNEHIGITSNYIDLISQKTGIKFELIVTDSWTKSNEMIISRDADLYACVSKTTDREKILNFSTAYIELPQIFVTNKDVNFIGDIKELYGKKLVLIDGYSITEAIQREHPEIEIIKVKKITDAFKILIEGKAYAYIDGLPIASYYIQKKGYSNLKISGLSGYEYEFSMALREDWGIKGIEVINKALNSITEEEKGEIYNKWLKVKYDREIDYTLIWQVSAFVLFFIAGTLYWNRKLSVEVKKRKRIQVKLQEINKKLEIAKKDAQSASRAKSDFLSNMSHEIRTPMNAILGFAELLDNQIEDKKQKSFIKTIRSSGQTLLHLINDILDLSKIESGKLEIIKTKVNINNVLEETIAIFKLLVKQKGLKLELILDEDIPTSLLLDSHRFKEILINLIGNAIKFTDSGYVKVIVLVDEVYEHNSKVDLTFKVKDSGIGIEKSNIEKIFNMFEQSENQDTKKYGGTGLGLAISRKLAILMGATLEVKSEFGAGSEFIVSFKGLDIASIGDEDNFCKATTDNSSIVFDSATILLVDDVKQNRDLVRENFRDTKVKVLEATNGKEAVEIARDREIDLIIMDIRMPVMDGYSATRIIKEFSDVPVVALTASIIQNELKKLDGNRFDGFLRKPVSKDELFKEVIKFLSYESIVTTLEEKNKEIDIQNIEELRDFLDVVDDEMQKLYIKAETTNDLSIISTFCQKLLKLSKKYNIKPMIDYSELLLHKIEIFEIDSINIMLENYIKKIEELKSISKN
ncbi:MAG: transporter substrate-binding domain-containing protein [Sulfurimonas sp.]|nr:transporter substrate-binding domain-containing protein [Sulfurimonas sp.]